MSDDELRLPPSPDEWEALKRRCTELEAERDAAKKAIEPWKSAALIGSWCDTCSHIHDPEDGLCDSPSVSSIGRCLCPERPNWRQRALRAEAQRQYDYDAGLHAVGLFRCFRGHVLSREVPLGPGPEPSCPVCADLAACARLVEAYRQWEEGGVGFVHVGVAYRVIPESTRQRLAEMVKP